jgi:catechol 2,3-dioxygenase-like lactoylglutathione lyase family enzyme
MPRSKEVRLGHVSLEVSDLAAARRFYDGFLPLLGFTRVPLRGRFWIGYRKAQMAIWVTSSRPRRAVRRRPHVPTDGARDPISDHLGFWVPSLKLLQGLEKELTAKGYRAVYPLDKVPTGPPFSREPSWYVSCAYSDPDNNVLELYTMIER